MLNRMAVSTAMEAVIMVRLFIFALQEKVERSQLAGWSFRKVLEEATGI
jgi:hypothetical protein